LSSDSALKGLLVLFRVPGSRTVCLYATPIWQIARFWMSTPEKGQQSWSVWWKMIQFQEKYKPFPTHDTWQIQLVRELCVFIMKARFGEEPVDLCAVASFKGVTNNVSCQFQSWSRLHWEWDSICDSSESAFADHLGVKSWGFTLLKRICRGSPKFHVWALCLLITWFWTDDKSRAHIKMAER
jgi:hypothetical protein